MMTRISSQAGLASIRAGVGYEGPLSSEPGGNPFNAIKGDRDKIGGPFNPIVRKKDGMSEDYAGLVRRGTVAIEVRQ